MDRSARTLLCLLITWCLPLAAWSQSIAHLNLGNMLWSLPEIKHVEGELRKFNESLDSAYRSRAAELQAAVDQVNADHDAGVITSQQREARLGVLEQRSKELEEFRVELEGKAKQKQAELFAPLAARVRGAVQAVASEREVGAVIDTSLFQVALFARESGGLEELVLRRLGVTTQREPHAAFEAGEGPAKLAYANAMGLMAALPELARAELEVHAKKSSLRAMLDQRVRDLDAQESEIGARARSGALDASGRLSALEDLRKRRVELVELHQQGEERIRAANERLMRPIEERLNENIRRLGKARGFDLILDSAVVLHAADRLRVDGLIMPAGGRSAPGDAELAKGVKFAFVDGMRILEDRPGLKALRRDLELLELQRQRDDDARTAKMTERESKVASGELSGARQQEIDRDLRAMQSKLDALDSEIKKKSDAMVAVGAKLEAAIAAVATQHGIDMVIDLTAAIYADESVVMSDEVRAKLGM